MTKITLWALALSVLGFIRAEAQRPLSLEDAIAIGLQRNYRIQMALNDAEIARTNNDWGAAGRYPDVDATVNLNNGFNENRNPAGFLREISALNSGATPGLEAVWIVFGGHRVKLNKEQFDLLENLAQGNVRQALETAIEDIILSYYQAVIQQEQLLVRAEVLKLSRERLEYQRTRQEFGQSSTFDVIQTQDAYLNDSTSFLVQQTNLVNAMRNLYRAIGEDSPGEGYTLTDRLPVEAAAYDLEALRTQMLSSNQALSNLRIGRELANMQTRIQESFRLPTVSLRAGSSYSLNRNIFGAGTFADGRELDLGGVQTTSLNMFANVAATWNLFDGGLRKRNVQNTRIQELNAQLGIDDLRRTLAAQLESTFEAYNNQKQVVSLSNNLVDNAKRNIEIAEERFRGGLISFFDYRSIQVSYINATQTRFNALYNLKTTETELLRLAGGLARG